MSKILVTGAHGFLGHHVVQRFSQYKKIKLLIPTSRELDLTNPSQTMDYFDRERPDKVLHMAAICRGILANKNHPAEFLHLNAKMVSNIFDAVYKYDIKYVYALGSVCSYPGKEPIPFKEDNFWNGFPEITNGAYGISKRFQLAMQQAYREQYEIKGAHFIFANLFGEHDHFDLQNSHVIPALIRRFYEAMENNSPEVRCWGTGQATREFIYAGDCADILVKCVIEEFDSHLPINIGTGKSISIKELANMIARLTGYRGKIVFTGEVSDGQLERQLDISRAKELLGFEAKTALMTGLVKTICWYQENKHLIKD